MSSSGDTSLISTCNSSRFFSPARRETSPANVLPSSNERNRTSPASGDTSLTDVSIPDASEYGLEGNALSGQALPLERVSITGAGTRAVSLANVSGTWRDVTLRDGTQGGSIAGSNLALRLVGVQVDGNSSRGLTVNTGGGTLEKPVGLVYVGLAVPGETKVKECRFGNHRENNRDRSAVTALDMIRRYLQGIE